MAKFNTYNHIKELLDGTREILILAKNNLERIIDSYGMNSDEARKASDNYARLVEQLLPYTSWPRVAYELSRTN